MLDTFGATRLPACDDEPQAERQVLRRGHERCPGASGPNTGQKGAGTRGSAVRVVLARMRLAARECGFGALAIVGKTPRRNPLHNRLVLPLLTENLQYQRIIKDQAVPGEAEAALTRISSLCLTITRFHGLFPDFLTS